MKNGSRNKLSVMSLPNLWPTTIFHVCLSAGGTIIVPMVSVAQKDVSFLSRGPRVIWRHFKCFKCKGLFLKDRSYRLDHEEMLFTENLDAIPVAEVSAELRAEIEQTPPVTLGKMNKFVEDEVDALVGVPSNVPPTTLVGCLFELLRSGSLFVSPLESVPDYSVSRKYLCLSELE